MVAKPNEQLPDPLEVRDWLLPYNLIVRQSELDNHFMRLGLDWRLVWEPAFEENLHSIRVLALARQPDDWEMAAVQVFYRVPIKDWQDALAESGIKLLELIAGRMEMFWRSLIETLLTTNPASQKTIVGYI